MIFEIANFLTILTWFQKNFYDFNFKIVKKLTTSKKLNLWNRKKNFFERPGTENVVNAERRSYQTGTVVKNYQSNENRYSYQTPTSNNVFVNSSQVVRQNYEPSRSVGVTDYRTSKVVSSGVPQNNVQQVQRTVGTVSNVNTSLVGQQTYMNTVPQMNYQVANQGKVVSENYVKASPNVN